MDEYKNKIYEPIEEHIKTLIQNKVYIVSFEYEYNYYLKSWTYSVSGKNPSKGTKKNLFCYSGVLPYEELERLLNFIGNPVKDVPLRFIGFELKKFLKRISYYILYFGT
jgi:hypothetical protein